MPDKNEVGNAFAAALRSMFEENPDRTITSAAEQLNVSRQAFHAYLKGKLPRQKTLNRAMQMWNLRLNLGDQSFDKGAFNAKEGKKEQPSKPTQLTFWEMLGNAREEDLHVTVKRVGRVLRFDVRIEVPA